MSDRRGSRNFRTSIQGLLITLSKQSNNQWWSAISPWKSIPCVDKRCVSVFCLPPVTGALWKRSKCVIWSASVWSFWSRLFCKGSVHHLRRVAGAPRLGCIRNYCWAIGRVCLLMRMWNCVICIITVKELSTKQPSSHSCMIALFFFLQHLQIKLAPARSKHSPKRIK